jgi:hypothetical protein
MVDTRTVTNLDENLKRLGCEVIKKHRIVEGLSVLGYVLLCKRPAILDPDATDYVVWFYNERTDKFYYSFSTSLFTYAEIRYESRLQAWKETFPQLETHG